MARATTTNQLISGSYTSHKGATYLTMALWMRRAASNTIQNCRFGDNVSNLFGPNHYSDNNIYFATSNGSNSSGISTQNITGWNHYCMVFDGTGGSNSERLTAYVNGSELTLAYEGTVPSAVSSGSAIETLRVGKLQWASLWSTGEFAELAVWNAALVADDVASLADGFSPAKIRPDSLLLHWPMVRDVLDVVTSAALTDTNTTVADHPKVYI